MTTANRDTTIECSSLAPVCKLFVISIMVVIDDECLFVASMGPLAISWSALDACYRLNAGRWMLESAPQPLRLLQRPKGAMKVAGRLDICTSLDTLTLLGDGRPNGVSCSMH